MMPLLPHAHAMRRNPNPAATSAPAPVTSVANDDAGVRAPLMAADVGEDEDAAAADPLPAAVDCILPEAVLAIEFEFEFEPDEAEDERELTTLATAWLTLETAEPETVADAAEADEAPEAVSGRNGPRSGSSQLDPRGPRGAEAYSSRRGRR